MESNSIFKASIFSGNSSLDTAKIQTAGQYITLHQVVRPLTQLNKQGQIASNAVKSWKISSDGKIYSLFIDDNLLWSDGTKIQIEDIINSLNRQRELKTANHFDFTIIKNITKVNSTEIQIELKDRNNNFIRQMSYPEFGIVKIKDDLTIDFSKVSGAYSISEIHKDYFLLKKNIFFPFHTTSSPNFARIEWGDSNDKKHKVEKDELDFFVPFSDFDKKTLQEIISKNYKQVIPHIGYSFWLTLNPKSQKFKDQETRNRIQVILKKTKLEFSKVQPFWVEANQIYLPDGLGRPSEKEIKSIWDAKFKQYLGKVNNLELKILLDETFPFSQNIIEQLHSHHIKTEVDWISPGNNIFELLKNKNYDLIMARNDFSSIDLHENLQTTFNENNPLIVTTETESQYQNELKLALNLETIEERSHIYKDIAKDIINKGFVVPLAYHQILFVHKKHYDISSWSTLFPEISLWKIKSN